MTKEEFLKYAEKFEDKRAVLNAAKQIQAEGLVVTEEELDKRLGVAKEPVEPRRARHEKVRRLEPKDLRAYARSDIKWKDLTKLMAVFVSILTVLSLMEVGAGKMGVVGAIIASALSLGMSALLLITSVGVTKSFLDVRRNERMSGLFGAMNRVIPAVGASILLSLVLMGVMLIPGIVSMLLMTKIPVVAVLIMLIGVVGVVYMSFVYSQTMWFCVDGDGPVASMKKSRLAMRGNKFRFFKTILPCIGWSILSSAAMGLPIGVPAGIAMVRNGYSKIGIIIAIILIVLAVIAMLIPLMIYTYMVEAEFYDDLNGVAMNPLRRETTKAPAKIVAIVLAAATILSGIFVALPVKWHEIGDTKDLAELAETELPSTPDPGNVISDPIMEKTTDPDISYKVPKGYTLDSNSDYLTAYFSDDDSLFIYKDKEEDDAETLQYFRDEYGADDITIGKVKGVYYKVDDEFAVVFPYNGYIYQITGTNEADTRELIESI